MVFSCESVERLKENLAFFACKVNKKTLIFFFMAKKRIRRKNFLPLDLRDRLIYAIYASSRDFSRRDMIRLGYPLPAETLEKIMQALRGKDLKLFRDYELSRSDEQAYLQCPYFFCSMRTKNRQLGLSKLQTIIAEQRHGRRYGTGTPHLS